MIQTKRHTCRECGTPLDGGRKASMEFCCTGHRVSWRNRRMSRGADLYDLFMAMRYDRTEAAELGLWNLMCRMATVWNEEDKANHRQSYFPPKTATQKYIHLRGEVLVKGKR